MLFVTKLAQFMIKNDDNLLFYIPFNIILVISSDGRVIMID